MTNTLTYTINLNGTAQKGVIDLAGSAQAAATKFDKLCNIANKFANIGFAVQHSAAVFQKINNVVSGLENAYKAQAVTETKLAAVMRNTMQAGKDEINSILKLASAQQKLGVIGDEVQLAGAQELSTYLTKAESLKKLMPVMSDMLAQQYGINASQEQASNIAMMMGKVMDGQVGALSRYGYKFTEAQERILKYGTEAQRAATLADVVTAAVGGVNAALAKTPEGKLKQHANNMGDLRERVGKLVVEVKAALLPVSLAIGEFVEKIIMWFERNREKIMEVAGVITGVLVGALSFLWNIVNGVWSAFEGLLGVMEAIYPIVIALGAAVMYNLIATRLEFIKFAAAYYKHFTLLKLNVLWTKILTGAQLVLNGVIKAFTKHPYIAAIMAIISLVMVAVSWFKKFKSQQDEINKSTNEVAAKIGTEQYQINKLFEAIKRTNPESEKRKQLIDQLNEKYPGLLKNQDLMKAGIDKITEAQNNANKALAQNIFLQDFQKKNGEAVTKIMEAQRAVFELNFEKGYDGAQIREAYEKVDSVVKQAIDSGAIKGDITDTDISLLMNKAFPTIGKVVDGKFQYLNPLTAMVNDSGSVNIFRSLIRIALTEGLSLKKLSDFGTTLGLSPEELINSVNGPMSAAGGLGGGPGGAATNDAIATGGTRNTTIHINLGKMIETINFNGTTKENQSNIERNLAECLYRVLGTAETAAA